MSIGKLASAGIALLLCCAMAEALELRNAHVIASVDLTDPEKKAVEMLVHEVKIRTGLDWGLTDGYSVGFVPITIRHASGVGPAEGFHLRVDRGRVEIQGDDARGTLYGVGRFLRELRWSKGSAEIPDGLDIKSSPKYALRGHQIGYRPKVNTYDAWTPEVFEQYVRDLAVFGTNAIELIPPRSDDRSQSPQFLLPQMEMMVQMSRIISEYGLQVWIWYPALDKDYTDPRTVDFALKEWGDVFRRLPHIDAVFVPGGDPGSTPPRPLMNLLEKEAMVLRQSHPKAQMWVSPQGFDAKQLDEFLEIVQKQPAWLNGIVYGPWSRVSAAELRAKIPSRYPLRLYPDITHSFLCEYPVPEWDTAYAITEGRESINPRPTDEARIFRLTSPGSIGFITYSEGVNDDVNKMLWSSLGWNPDANVTEVLREYARYFIGPEFENQFAQGLLNLERNWRGSLFSNAMVDETLLQFRAMERAAKPQILRNWRFQEGLYRAYYDAYVRHRFLYETSLEQQATDQLRQAPRLGSLISMDQAEHTLDKAVTEPVSQDLRTRIFALAEALYQSIGMQLSVELYRAVHFSRGANLDTIDYPLNSRFWLKAQFANLRVAATEKARLAGIDAIVNRTNPGPGGFYDDLGKNAMQPHLVAEGPGYDLDPSAFHSVFTQMRSEGTGPQLETPTQWWDYAGTRQDTPLLMHYEDLDANAHYKIRVVYVGFANGPKCKLLANDKFQIHPYLAPPRPIRALDFDVPVEATRSGKLTLRWSLEPGTAGFASSVAVAEVLLIRE
ncbi:MAG TPA: hypothetical protein VHZ07_08210 [Bryobacteraceae bacterium]|nr:hypothetical protein [Bryobacteraceae bacterium]